MSESTISVYGHGSVSVDTDRLRSESIVLHRNSEELASIGLATARLSVLSSDHAISVAPESVDMAAQVARRAAECAQNAQEASRALTWLCERYEDADRVSRELVHRAVDGGSWVLGRWLALGALAAGPLWVIGAGVALLALRPWERGGRRQPPTTPPVSRAIVNRLVPGIVRTVVNGADGFMAGVMGVPPAVLHAAGSGGSGQRGVESSTRVLATVGKISGAVRDSPVGAVRLSESREVAPSNLEDLVARVPTASDGGANVRIDSVTTDGAQRWIVYLGGTVTTDAGSSHAFDMTSNLAALSGETAASERAALIAMREAGISPQDPVLLVGHSQGGLIAARLAQHPELTVSGVVTAGAPVAALPTGVPTIDLVHSDDVIPALGGEASEPEPQRITIEREVYRAHEPAPDDYLAAHHLHDYTQTAREADASANVLVRSVRNEYAPFLNASETQSSFWSAQRLSTDCEVSRDGQVAAGSPR